MVQSQPVSRADKPERRRAHAALPSEVDVAIVGSGIGGLTAGAYLARRGFRVALFEAHYVAGGCATQFARGARGERYHFDVGLHYIGDCGEGGTIPRLLRGAGVEIAYAPLDPDGFDTLVFPDLRFRIPADVARYRDRLAGLFPHEVRAIDRYVRVLRAVMHAAGAVERGDGRVSLRAGLALWRDAFHVARFKNSTVAELLDAVGARDPRLRAILLGQSGDYGLPPSQASAIIHLGLAGHYFRGAYYPKGGGQVPADRLADVIERSGGSIHLRRGVERIVVENGRAVGVRLEPRAGEPGPLVRARAVLSNADLKVTMLRLLGPEHLPASYVTRTRKQTMAGALFMTFLGVRGDLRDKGMGATNYWQFDGYDLEDFYAATGARGEFRPRGCYITSASLKDPENALHHAPGGVTNVEVMTVVPPVGPAWGAGDGGEGWSYKHDGAYVALKQSIEDDMIGRLDALFPGSAASIVYRESATPMTHQRFTRASEGAGYGLAATPAQFLDGRPGYRTPVAGLYVAGASTRAGHGIVGAMMSGRQAAKRLAADLGRPLPAFAP
jgi:all-trans-retinol 13,14-reductase